MKKLEDFIQEKLVLTADNLKNKFNKINLLKRSKSKELVETIFELVKERYSNVFNNIEIIHYDESNTDVVKMSDLKPENQGSSNAFNVSEYYVDINFRDSEQPWARVGGFSIKRVGPGRRSQNEMSFLFRHIDNFRDAIEKFEEILKEKNIKF
jgi:hypothetical protein